MSSWCQRQPWRDQKLSTCTHNSPHARTTLPFISLFHVPAIFVLWKYINNEQYWKVCLPVLRSVLKSRPSAEKFPVRCLFQQTVLPVSSNTQTAIPSVSWYQWTSSSTVHVRCSEEDISVETKARVEILWDILQSVLKYPHSPKIFRYISDLTSNFLYRRSLFHLLRV